MIEEIKIQNFRTQTKQKIEFSKGVTTIVGSSFVGKSTIIKALKWVTLNKPAGDSVINWDADKAVVRVSFDDDKKVIRKKGKGLNSYKLNKKVFEAFGNEVPRQIANLFNIAEINFQGQFTAPFWFCETAGEVSRQLNAIVNLDIIDSTLSNIDGQSRKTKIVIDITEKDLKLAIERKKELTYIKDLNKDLVRVEGFDTQSCEKAIECSTIAELLKSGYMYASTRKNARELVLDGKNALSKGKILQEMAEPIENLFRLIQNGRAYQKTINTKPPSLKPIEDLKLESGRLSSLLESFEGLMELVKEKRSEKCQAEKELLAYREKFKKIVGKECPLCGNPIKKI